jgi:hypothetical protein
MVRDYHGIWGVMFNSAWAGREPIHVATDGSYQSGYDNGGRSSWSVCIIDDYLQKEYIHFPSSELLYDDRVVAPSSMVCGSIPQSTSIGIFMAELHAVYRALVLFPAAVSLVVWIDSKSVIAAIERYHNEVRSRRKLRMSGRPLLELINQLRVGKRGAAPGTTVEFAWQRAHTEDKSLVAVANRIADYAAKRSIDNWSATSSSSVNSSCSSSRNVAIIVGDEKRSGPVGVNFKKRRMDGSSSVAVAKADAQRRPFNIPLVKGEDYVAVLEPVNQRNGDEADIRKKSVEPGGPRVASRKGIHMLRRWKCNRHWECDLCGKWYPEMMLCETHIEDACFYAECFDCHLGPSGGTGNSLRTQRSGPRQRQRGADGAMSDGEWRVVSGDVRSAARARLRTLQVRAWQVSESQSYFAAHSAAVAQLWRAVTTDSVGGVSGGGGAMYSSWLLRALANVLQFTGPVAVRSCTVCIDMADMNLVNVVYMEDTIEHLVECTRVSRVRLRHDIVGQLLQLNSQPKWQGEGTGIGGFAVEWRTANSEVQNNSWELTTFLCDIGLLSRGELLDSQSNTESARKSRAGVVLAMLGGFSAQSISCTKKKWRIQFADDWLLHVRRILLRNWQQSYGYNYGKGKGKGFVRQ